MPRSNEAIRAWLLARRRTLLRRYRDELERVEEELAAPQSELVEKATEQWDAEVLSSLGDTDLRAIVAVVEALSRLDRGSYGRCTECDQPITAARLEALPETPFCIRCASAHEPAISRSA